MNRLLFVVLALGAGCIEAPPSSSLPSEQSNASNNLTAPPLLPMEGVSVPRFFRSFPDKLRL